MAGNGDASKPGLTDEQWMLVYQRTRARIRRFIAPRRWRGACGGLLPRGANADTITSEAIAQVLQEEQEHPGASSDDFPSTLRKVQRRAYRIADGLWHLQENFRCCNIPELPPFFTDDGESVNPVENIPDPGPDSLAQLIQHQDQAGREAAKNRFQAFLGKNRALKGVFNCLCAGIWTPKAMARKLKLSLRAILTLRKRFQRKVAEFAALQKAEKFKKNAKKVLL